MRFSSIFDEPIRKLEKEFFSSTRRSNDAFSWPNRSTTSPVQQRVILPRPDLLDRREYNETLESRVEDEEIEKNSATELVLKINCIEFRPEEITVTVEENQLLIEGVQECTTTTGKTRRQFSRKITLPDDSLTKEMNCTAKQSGLLTICIPRKPVEKVKKKKKIIPIRLENEINNNATSTLNQPSTVNPSSTLSRQSSNQPLNQ